MVGFEFTPQGIAQLAQPSGEVDYSKTLFLDVRTNGEGGDPRAEVPETEPEQTPRKALGGVPLHHAVGVAAPTPQKPTQKLTPRSIVKQARARRAELKRLLKQAKAWERELAQLERLIAAADGRPVAVLKQIDSRRVG